MTREYYTIGNLGTKVERPGGNVNLHISQSEGSWKIWGWEGDMWSTTSHMLVVGEADTKEGALAEFKKLKGLAMLRLVPGIDR